MIKNIYKISKALVYAALLCMPYISVQSKGKKGHPHRRRTVHLDTEKNTKDIRTYPSSGRVKSPTTKKRTGIGSPRRIRNFPMDVPNPKSHNNQWLDKKWIISAITVIVIAGAVFIVMRGDGDDDEGGKAPNFKFIKPEDQILEPFDESDRNPIVRTKFGYAQRAPLYNTTEDIIRKTKTLWNNAIKHGDIEKLSSDQLKEFNKVRNEYYTREELYDESLKIEDDIALDGLNKEATIGLDWQQLSSEFKMRLCEAVTTAVITANEAEEREKAKDQKLISEKERKKRAFATVGEAMAQLDIKEDGIYLKGIKLPNGFKTEKTPSFTCPLCTFDVTRKALVYCPIRPHQNHYTGCIACTANMLPKVKGGGLVYECHVHDADDYKKSIQNISSACYKLVHDPEGRTELAKKGIVIEGDSSNGFYVKEYK